MPLRCPCGNDNPDESVYCNECGRSLLTPEGPVKCSRCGHVNPEHVAYCGRCGMDLYDGQARAVRSGDFIPSQSPDAYLVHEGLAGGSWVTKPGFWIVAALMAIYTLMIALELIVFEGHLLCGSIYVLFVVAILYLYWRSGREGAGWRD